MIAPLLADGKTEVLESVTKIKFWAISWETCGLNTQPPTLLTQLCIYGGTQPSDWWLLEQASYCFQQGMANALHDVLMDR